MHDSFPNNDKLFFFVFDHNATNANTPVRYRQNNNHEKCAGMVSYQKNQIKIII